MHSEVAVMNRLFFLCGLIGWAAVAQAEGGTGRTFVATVDGNGVQRVEVVGGDYYFEPNHIVVKAGVPVELVVRKESGFTPHTFVMDAPSAGMRFNVDLGEPRAVRFTPSKPGVYGFYCDKQLLFFESHREKGMEGTLEVLE
ncbi:hypothetical protein MoryE10_26600 [Methylogaea oryzae]|uniref:EfeO-type cupredoxin-like domain-containing protein n=2 Tax=Methylogaea oryzae TaxID=1295382 RepID=A0A8D4VRP4_9GAMM|nr:hypothetical protein MoryE10_26600 [Methylogaea oryzae]